MWQVIRSEGFSRAVLQVFADEGNAKAFCYEQNRAASLATDGIPKVQYTVEEIKNG